MFLWVALLIHSLCTLHTDEAIRDALSHLPRDLSQIYSQLLERQMEPGIKYQRRIFELITAAQRPLTTSEIREALSVTIGDTTWSTAKLINDVYSTLATCGCLVIVDEEELTVRFVHPTVEQFLFERYLDLSGDSMSIDACHKTMAEVIVTYLNFGVFMTDISTFRIPHVNVGSTPSKVISSTMASSKSAQSIALRLLKLKKRSDFDIGRVIAEGLQADKESQSDTVEYHFYQYAKDHCFIHVTKSLPRGPHIKKLLPPLLVKVGTLNMRLDSGTFHPADIMQPHSVFSQGMVSTARNNDRELMELFLEANRSFTKSAQNIQLALSEAICMGLEDMIELLIADSEAAHYFSLKSATYKGALCHWAHRSFTEFHVELDFLGTTSDSDVNHLCKSGRTLLACAIWGNNETVLRALLCDGRIKVNAGGSQMTPIWEAVRTGNTYAVNELVSRTNRLDSGGRFRANSVEFKPGEISALISFAMRSDRMDTVDGGQTRWWQSLTIRKAEIVATLLRISDFHPEIGDRNRMIKLAVQTGNQFIKDRLQMTLREAIELDDEDCLARLVGAGIYRSTPGVRLDSNSEVELWEAEERAALIRLAAEVGNLNMIRWLQPSSKDATIPRRVPTSPKSTHSVHSEPSDVSTPRRIQSPEQLLLQHPAEGPPHAQ